jgi:hypothetical protein
MAAANEFRTKAWSSGDWMILDMLLSLIAPSCRRLIITNVLLFIGAAALAPPQQL